MGQERQQNPLEAFLSRAKEASAIDPRLAEVISRRLSIPQDVPVRETEGPSIEDILGLREGLPGEFKGGGYVEPLRVSPLNQGGALNAIPNRMLGALPGGREDFKGGKHVAGEGDGQSDDIPAWLADGEFVFPADVVSALGNGSTKAGTDKLYEMMHNIRKRARSTKHKDLPPPAHKSPLDYLKKGK